MRVTDKITQLHTGARKKEASRKLDGLGRHRKQLWELRPRRQRKGEHG